MRQETKEKLKALMDRAVAHHELAGGCLLVRQHNEEVCCLEAGMADVESGKPIQRDQIYLWPRCVGRYSQPLFPRIGNIA